jgi:hypothetical protein
MADNEENPTSAQTITNPLQEGQRVENQITQTDYTSQTAPSSTSEAEDIKLPQKLAEKVEKIATDTSLQISTLKATEVSNNLFQDKLPRFTEILGVFVALFTFVSVEIQVFSRVNSLGRAVIFTFLIFLCMTGFIFMLHMIINLKNDSECNAIKSAILPFVGLLIIIGVGVGTISYLIKNDIPLDTQEYKEIEEMKKDIDVLKIKTGN